MYMCVCVHACTVHVIMYVMHVCVCVSMCDCVHYFIHCFRSKKKRKKKLFPMVCSCTLVMHALHTLYYLYCLYHLDSLPVSLLINY